MYTIDPNKQTEVLRWLMYAWDSQWQARTLALYGPIETARLSARVRSAFGKVEMKALLALVGKERAINLADAAELLEAYFGFVWGERGFQGRFLPLETSPNGLARLTVQIKKMTALDSLKKAAQAAGEDPRLPCEMLWNAWLETLLPNTQVQVTARLGEAYDQFQIDNLGETLPNSVAFPGQFEAVPEFERPNSTLPGEADFEASPIAAALQIPLERVAPGLTGELAAPADLNDPYASGPASYSPPSGATNVPVGPDSLRYAPAPSQANLFSTHQLSSQQLIGATEAGADQNLMRRGGTGGLTSRLQQKAESVLPPELPIQPAWAAAPLPPTGFQGGLPPVTPSTVDPTTGQRLYSIDPEDEARSRVLRSKNLPLMSRLFMSREARDLIDKGKDEPLVQLSSIAGKVDLILQRYMAQARTAYPGQFLEPVRVMGGPEGALQILVGSQIYQSIEQVPPGPVLDIIKQSVEEYSQTS